MQESYQIDEGNIRVTARQLPFPYFHQSDLGMFTPSDSTLDRHKSGTPFLDVCLLIGFLLEAIIAKSQFDGLIGGWRGHMILTIAMLALFLVRGAWKWTKGSFYFTPPRPIGVTLAIACVWAIFCCVAQPNAYANLVFLGVFAIHIYVCLYIAPNLVLPYLGERGVLLYALPLFLVTIICLTSDAGQVAQGSASWRSAGITDNATHLGSISSFASILALWMVLEWKRHRLAWFAIWILCVVALLMTRTRASIFGWAVGSIVMVVYWARSSLAAHLRLLVVIILLLVLMLVGLGVVAYPELFSLSQKHLRASDWEELFQSRKIPWEIGIANVAKHPLFGEGPMARFSNTNDPTNVDAYDVDRVYCSTWLAFAQAYGIPGSLLFAWVCFIIALSAIRRQIAIPLLLVGVMFSCVPASFGFSWLVSFGTPSDRVTWLVMGLALAVPRPHPIARS